VLIGNGDGTFQGAPMLFTTPPTGNQRPRAGSVAVADFDADGRLDFAVGHLFNNATVVRAIPDGGFAPPTDLGRGRGPVAVGDFNGDGRPDVAVCGAGGSGSNGVSVFLGNGNGTFGVPIETIRGGDGMPSPACALILPEPTPVVDPLTGPESSGDPDAL
jgi:hypothetical protein